MSELSAKPRILLVCTVPWISAARLAMAFVNAGCRVELVCPPAHPVAKTRAAARIHRYRPLMPLRSIASAIDAAQVDCIIPCDDLATICLHRLHDQDLRAGESATRRRLLLERSLGDPSSFSVAASRTRLLAVARDLEIPVPPTAVVSTTDELANWLASNSLPAVLKADGTSGGRGVRVAHTPAEAHTALKALSSPPSPARAIKRAIVNGDLNYLLPCLLRTRPVVSVQGFVSGQDANSTVVCWEGKVLANISVAVLRTWGRRGPACVVRVIDHAEIAASVERIVGRLKLSGMFGFDFIIEERTGRPYLIEMNPRATQSGHLQLGARRDLIAALHATLSGKPLPVSPAVIHNKIIAFFPQEWLRNPASRFTKSAYHDVPWDEPDLVRACIQETLAGRIWGALSSRLRAITASHADGSTLSADGYGGSALAHRSSREPVAAPAAGRRSGGKRPGPSVTRRLARPNE